jgi:hypothetical protein
MCCGLAMYKTNQAELRQSGVQPDKKLKNISGNLFSKNKEKVY